MDSKAVRASSLLLTVIMFASIWRGGCQIPVLFPSPFLIGALVENEETGKIYSVNGAIPQFYMNNTGDPEAQCTDHLLIRTSSQHITLWFELLDDEGRNQALPPFGSNINVRLDPIGDVEPALPSQPENNSSVPEPPRESSKKSKPPKIFNRNETAVAPQEIQRLEADVTLPSEAFMLNVKADVNGTARCARVVLDQTKPKVKKVQTKPAKKGLLAGQFVKFVIDFSEKVVAIPPNRGNCRRKVIEMAGRNENIFEQGEQSEACSEDLNESNLQSVIQLTNARNVTRTFKRDGTRVVVEAIAKTFTQDVEMKINERSFMDYAGNEIQTTITASFTPVRKLSSRVRRNRLRRRPIRLKKVKEPKEEEPRGKEQAQKMGKAVTAAVAAATAVSVVGAGGATQLLGSAQKVFFTGMLAVSNMPENYQGFTSELSWAGMDMDLPGSDSNDEEEEEPEGVRKVVIMDSFETNSSVLTPSEEQLIDPETNGRSLLSLGEGGRRKLKQQETGDANEDVTGGGEEEQLGTGKKEGNETETESLLFLVEEDEEEEDGIRGQVQAIQGILEADDDGGLALVQRVLFWAALILAGILFLHASSLGLCLWKRWPIPDFCQPPRIEILFAYWAMPAIAAAASSLFNQSQEGDEDTPPEEGNTRWEALLGTWLLIAFPIAFLSWNIYMLSAHFSGRSPSDRAANMVLDEEEAPPDLGDVMKSLKVTSGKVAKSIGDKSNSEGATSRNNWAGTSSENDDNPSTPVGLDQFPGMQGGSETEEQSQEEDHEQENQGEMNGTESDEKEGKEGEDEEEQLSCWKRVLQMFDVIVFTTLFGKHQPPGDWVVTKPGSRFIAQYGPIFMDHRGCPAYRKGATYEVDPENRTVNRGYLLPFKEIPLLTLTGTIPFTDTTIIPGEFSLYRYHLQIVTTILDFTKGTLIACLVGGINEEDSKRQILALLLISVVMMAIIRISLPFVRRAEMVVALLGELADVITFSLSLYLILYAETDDAELRFRVGLTMLAAEGAAMLSLIIDRTLLSLEIMEIVKEKVKEMRCPHLFFKAIMTYLQRYDPYLERKYFDRWMVKALYKGLHGRKVPRVELPPGVYIKQETEKTIREMVSTMRGMQKGLLRRKKRRSESWRQV